jgi:DNA-binding response OmpR family regulator
VSRLLLADHSPHAQRMGERILRDEGWEVVTVTDGDTAVLRLDDADPDVILADVNLPSRNGYDLSQYVKSNLAYRYMRVILTAGATVDFDEDRARRMGADATIRKPFEPTTLLDTIRPLMEQVRKERAVMNPTAGPAVDPAKVRAAVTLALDAAMPAMIHELTERVLQSLKD